MIFKDVVHYVDQGDKRTDFLDRIFLHPVLGLLSLAIMMFIVFQAVLHGQLHSWMVLKASSAGLVR